MDEQLDQAKITPPKKRRTVTVLSGFAVLFIAIFAVNAIATNDNDNASDQNADAVVATVRITEKGFEPAVLAVKTGTEVTWTNTGNSLHQVAANPYPRGGDLSNLKSAILNGSQTYTYVASTAGNFSYHDQMNPAINGTLVVQK